ncbi:MAG: DUF5119 domain-containing protein [Muribaculum sp.]|nr:DUF5119 domain-containing protein [Muribaculum sp.]
MSNNVNAQCILRNALCTMRNAQSMLWNMLLSILPLMAVVTLLLLMSSCEHKEFCYDHPHGVRLQLVYDWSEAPDANPAGMCVFFYPVGRDVDSYATRFDFSNTRGGEIQLKPGRYLALTYNNDTEAVQFGGTGAFDMHFGYTRTGHILEPMYGNGLSTGGGNGNFCDEEVVITPDCLWGCSETEVVVTGEEDQTITLYPHDMLCLYSYEVRNVDNLDKVAKISGALSGMSPALYLAGETLHDDHVTLPVEAWKDGESTVRGQFYTFGHHEELSAPHRMAFYVEMIDGSKYSFTSGSNLDVTGQVHSAPDRRRVHLVIDGLSIPTPIEGGSGMVPDLDDWDDVQQDIEL